MLLEGESLVMRTHRHWIVLVGSLWIPVVLVALLVVADVLLRPQDVSQDVRLVANLAVLALVGLWLIVAWIRWSSAAILLTDRRVILETGFLARSSKVIGLDRVQDVTTRQGLLARLLGYGRIEIDAAGPGGAEVFEHVAQPRRFRDQVFVQTERFRHPEPRVEPEPEPEPAR